MDVKTAMFERGFPCNPRPFLAGLLDYIEEHGTQSIRSNEAKQILFVIMAQAYGQLSTIDLCDEWRRLDDLYQQNKEEHVS
tara:strand:- start:3467 stop:3709 length:243 start_codon:yes stop_codon:yes gene_type:complete